MGLKYGKGLYFGTRGSIVNTYFKVFNKTRGKNNDFFITNRSSNKCKEFLE